MESVLINNKLQLAQPEGFRVMDHDELVQAYQTDYDSMWGMRDEERHIIFAVIWKVTNKVLGALAGSKTVAEQAEKALRKSYKDMDYRCDDRYKITVAGKTAHGFRYSYTNQGQDQAAETFVVQDGASCYTFYYYTRAELAEENRSVFDEILASIKL